MYCVVNKFEVCYTVQMAGIDFSGFEEAQKHFNWSITDLYGLKNGPKLSKQSQITEGNSRQKGIC
jgi:hypothetical protein